jgi:hypothetical protein
METNKIKYKDFPQALKDKVLEIRAKQYPNPLSKSRNLDDHCLAMLFKFNLTEEGKEYWLKLYNENKFNQYKKPVKNLKDKVIKKSYQNKITKVTDGNGSLYLIGDTIRIFEKSCVSYGEIYKILDFRWNIDNTRICAVTKKHKNGIRLDWIEHYVEIKKEPEFALPEKWYIKPTIENFNIVKNWAEKISNHNYAFFKYRTHVCFCNKGFYRNTLGLTQITFEQFKQYVLFNNLKVGDKIWNGEKTIIDLKYIDGQSIVFYKYTHNNHTSPGCRMLLKNVQK